MLDRQSEQFEADLKALHPNIVVHTAGPFQGQGYRVAEACIQVGSHYVDLADGRDFVQHFNSLNDEAILRNVLLVSGASTLPGLSTAVIDELGPRFDSIKSIRIVISPAHQTPPGLGTLAAVLGYCGKPFDVLENGHWTRRFGWQDLTKQHHPNLGFRLSGACNVPDLALMPDYAEDVATVISHASIESKFEQLTLWLMSWLTRLRIVRNWARYAVFFSVIRKPFLRFGSTNGGMHIELRGQARNSGALTLNWYLTARTNHGPEIPCTPALILIRKLVRGEIAARGARACTGLITLAEFDKEISDFNVDWIVNDEHAG